MYNRALRTRQTLSLPTTALHLLKIVYGVVQLNYVTLILTIPNMFTSMYTKSKT